jgi:hypothetical protein
VRGRPGIDPLGVNFEYVLEREAAEWANGRIQRLSKNYGTEMTVDNEIGVIRF